MRNKPLRICKHGSSASVVIPKAILEFLGLQLDDYLVAEITEDRRLIYRRPVARDLEPERIHKFLPKDSPAVIG